MVSRLSLSSAFFSCSIQSWLGEACASCRGRVLLRTFVLGGPLLAIILAPSLAMAEGDIDAKLQESEQDLGKIEHRVDSLTRELVGRREDRKALIAELEARERNVAELALANRELERLVEEHQRIAVELRARQAEERRALAGEVDQLSDLLRTAYVMGRADRLRLLLNQEDPTQASRVMSYFAYFNRERLRRILAVQQSAERLDALALDAEAEASRLAELARSQEATHRRLLSAKERRAKVLQQLEASIQSRTETLDVLNQDAESLKLLVKHLRQKAQISAELDIDHDPFPVRKGRLAWPILEGRVLANFGTRKEDSDLDWDGVLLAAEAGEEVRAVSDGRVLYADWLRGFGLLLVLDHGDGYMTLYGHNEALLREVGEWVSTGEPIALTGNSGGRADPVLYFAIRKDGRPQDPAKWCAMPGRRRAQLELDGYSLSPRTLRTALLDKASAKHSKIRKIPLALR
ncbi:peptidoglycan DD-metalloendopeptidase family protein [Thiorhodococcus mannitoliphagus]|uniref:Peptidoglycan DD-metalloendopeptidase family protein n=1 Tax=Thiorhodococcus mannitoliphagus TaxID=329406 RepID=A0A6P1DRX8_9GAMM|nr:peptidoglycan DD-metalloendopeptidase family protein [Thiorhodococcus mannitoliphagus]NEX18752.1 peptidoglycan DD-metalloendopeptidase family protein [Thiorhodococcus mannitoliphagus]